MYLLWLDQCFIITRLYYATMPTIIDKAQSSKRFEKTIAMSYSFCCQIIGKKNLLDQLHIRYLEHRVIIIFKGLVAGIAVSTFG